MKEPEKTGMLLEPNEIRNSRKCKTANVAETGVQDLKRSNSTKRVARNNHEVLRIQPTKQTLPRMKILPHDNTFVR